MVTIWTYDTAAEADLAKIYLEDCGIKVALADYHMVAMNWLRAYAFGGIKLQVAEKDVDRALSKLKELAERRSQPTDDSGSEETCLSCGAPMRPDEEICSECGWSYAD